MTNAKDSFIPKGYTVPVTSNYMKFQDGMNTFRFLSKPIMGMEYWKANPKDPSKRVPIRKRMGVNINVSDLEINPQSGKIDNPSHFWAMVVYNYVAKRIQILEIKQNTIIKAVLSYIENPKWGSPTEYDINVKKSGSLLTTEYLVDHDPKEPTDKEILKKYKNTEINLEALFDGADPFEAQKAKNEAPPIENDPDAFEKEIDKMPS